MSRPNRRRTKRNRPEPRSVNKGGYYYLYDAKNPRSNLRRPLHTKESS